MKVIIDGKTITLNNRDVRVAKKTLRHFLKTSKEEAEKHNSYSYYYTLLLVMHIMSNDLISSATPDFIQMVLDATAASQEKRETENQ